MNRATAVTLFVIVFLPACRSTSALRPVQSGNCRSLPDSYRVEGFAVDDALRSAPMADFEVQSTGPEGCDGEQATLLDLRGCAATCERHRQTLMEDLVNIQYGALRARSGDAATASRTQFPHARASIVGGCVPSCAKRARVLYCEACRASRLEWLRVHHTDDVVVCPSTERVDAGL
jgi:hypothetical protein